MELSGCQVWHACATIRVRGETMTRLADRFVGAGFTRRRHLRQVAALAGAAVVGGCGVGGASTANPAAPGSGCAAKLEVWGYGIGGDTMTQLIQDFTSKQSKCSIAETDQNDDA